MTRFRFSVQLFIQRLYQPLAGLIAVLVATTSIGALNASIMGHSTCDALFELDLISVLHAADVESERKRWWGGGGGWGVGGGGVRALRGG